MKVIEDLSLMRKEAESLRKSGFVIGFVPTMGAFHKGHIELIRKARSENDIVIVSIFVNPLQFDQEFDYYQYPRNLENDKLIAQQEGVDILFCPKAQDMYKDHKTFVEVEGLSDVLCGRYRPGHFRGVCTVVVKLFNLTKPHRAYFGKKDYQQLVIIKKLVEDLNFDIEIREIETVREEDGLACSSRNLYLTPTERQKAPCIYKALKEAQENILKQDLKTIKEKIKQTIEAAGLKVQYVEICSPYSLESLQEVRDEVLIAVCAFCGKARLIDNIIIKCKS